VSETSPAARAEADQSRASNPRASAWVAASAGSGKTKLLTDRVLRLLLAGTRPNRILCLTFTKAAAAEMALRLNHALGDWAVLDDAGLERALHRLLGRGPAPAEARAARTLFAEVLELPGGMRISTIHAFCQVLLRAFPLEAELPAQFAVLEERDASARLAEAREAVLARAAGAAPLRALAGLISAEGFSGLSRALADDADALRHALAKGGVAAVVAALQRALGAAPDIAAEIDAACTPMDETALARAAGVLLRGSAATDAKLGVKLRQFLALPQAQRHTAYDVWKSALLTQDGEPRKKFATQACGADQAWVQSLLTDEALRLRDHAQRINAADMISATRALLELAEPVLDAYAQSKALAGQLDFDDLITATETLLRDPGSAWVLFKLDSGLDHVLLDEAQDSNASQWGIVRALTSDFFAGASTRETSRSIFAVGDVKQSIYAFQGADPVGFGRGREHFGQAVRAAEGRFEDVALEVSFRSTPPVLALVDAVFDGAAGEGVVPPGGRLTHIPNRQGAAGMVELWPLQLAAPKGEPPRWDVAEEDSSSANAQGRLARALALRIRYMLAYETLPARSDGPDQPEGRKVRPEDILILVRRRNALTRLIIRELKQAGVPVGGLDRIALTAQIGVQDVLALLDVLLLPQDDLALAALLKSPLVGLSEDELFGLAQPRTGSLHAALMAHRGGEGSLGAAADWLAGWAGRADQGTPHMLLAQLLGADGARRKLLARLGPDAADGLDELLNAALTFEARHPPSLQGFLHWLRAGGAEVKRDAESSAGLVRIMTVHGAKGLQAPIVILPDTTGRGRSDTGLQWLVDEAGQALPLWSPRAEKPIPDAVERLRAAERARAQQEENRLLYVALTRAEDRLLVCGWSRDSAKPEEWYSHIAAGMARLDAASSGFDSIGVEGFSGAMLTLRAAQDAAPRDEAARRASGRETLPAWAATPAPIEGMARARAPSSLLDEESGPPAAAPHSPSDPLGQRFRRGRLIHALLQSLPNLPAAARAGAAGRFLARPGHGLDATGQQAIAAEVMALLDDPDFAEAFGPASLAEAPVAGRIGGQLLVGQVDRLCVSDTRVLVIDYKTNRPPPGAAGDVSAGYLRQMAAYRALLRLAFPGRVVQCALLWTYSARLMPLEDALLDIHQPAAS